MQTDLGYISDPTLTQVIGVLIGGEDYPSAIKELFTHSRYPNIALKLPCGNSLEFTLETFPKEDLECKCGMLSYPHYFVKYD